MDYDTYLLVRHFDNQVRIIRRDLRRLLTKQGHSMATLDDLTTAVGKIGPAINKLEAKITALLKGKLSPADQAKVDAAFDELGKAFADAEDGLDEADVPTALAASYADRASFDAAVAAYTGPERVTVDGADARPGTDPALAYFSHTADGSVSTTGPTD